MWGFGSCTFVDEVLVLPGCDVMPLGIWFLMFWDSIVGLIFEAKGVLMTLWPLKGRPQHCVDTLGTIYPVTQRHIPELIAPYKDKLWKWWIWLALVLAVLNLLVLLPQFCWAGWTEYCCSYLLLWLRKSVIFTSLYTWMQKTSKFHVKFCWVSEMGYNCSWCQGL